MEILFYLAIWPCTSERSIRDIRFHFQYTIHTDVSAGVLDFPVLDFDMQVADGVGPPHTTALVP